MEKNNKILSLVLFLLMSIVSFGQTGTLYRLPIGGNKSMVRQIPGSDMHIIYTYSPANENHFILTDFNMAVDVRVSHDLNVKDFEIIDEYVFFCGDNGGGSGFLGWFHIDSLFSFQSPVYVDQSLSALGLLSLDNIEVYNNQSGDICIAGYGVNRALSTKTFYSAFEAVGNLFSGMVYRTLDFYYTGNYADITDMAVTDNFVVYISDTRNQFYPNHVGIGVLLHPFPKYNMFGPYPSYVHAYQLTTISQNCPGNVVPIVSDPYWIPGSVKTSPQIVHSSSDRVAVCTHRRDLLDNCDPIAMYTSSNITNIQFDLFPLLGSLSSPVPMTSNIMAQLPLGQLYSMEGFIYDQTGDRYATLHRRESTTFPQEHTVTVFDFSLGTPGSVASYYQTFFDTHTGWLPTDMCLDDAPYYTIVGRDNSNLHQILWHNKISESSPCVNVVDYPVLSLPLAVEKTEANLNKPTDWQNLHFLMEPDHEGQYNTTEIMCN